MKEGILIYQYKFGSLKPIDIGQKVGPYPDKGPVFYWSITPAEFGRLCKGAGDIVTNIKVPTSWRDLFAVLEECEHRWPE